MCPNCIYWLSKVDHFTVPPSSTACSDRVNWGLETWTVKCKAYWCCPHCAPPFSIPKLQRSLQIWAQESMWRSTRRTSSMCTGVYTAEMALSAVANIINKSEVLDFRVDIRCVACWDWTSVQTIVRCCLCWIPGIGSMCCNKSMITTSNKLIRTAGVCHHTVTLIDTCIKCEL